MAVVRLWSAVSSMAVVVVLTPLEIGIEGLLGLKVLDV